MSRRESAETDLERSDAGLLKDEEKAQSPIRSYGHTPQKGLRKTVIDDIPGPPIEEHAGIFCDVAFHILAKIMTTPCVALLQYIFLGKSITTLTMGALASVCVGVALTNTGAAGTTTLGASIAIAAFTVTAFYQVWIGKKMKDFAVSSPQLLLNQAPISVLLLAFLAPFFDTVPNMAIIPRDTLIALFLSGLAAAALNLSQFLIIGRMSALTFNVASNVKTIIILTYGWVSEGRVLTLKDSLGILLALGGATLYSQLSSK
ncbi:hypothetical protein G7Y89_g6875 [Cudoniella acicularis]|uniref:Sugar phosphate transporter domain-containing protein n=1 Tax=Cudoniella acicularis TaxID=354080 RepID=A0A8H4W533_9HELO|nr:hypothetical protein G7Y89_g6875 [Cudoniella acicularis]